MGFAGKIASAWLEGQAHSARVFIGTFAVILAGGGTWYLYSNAEHSLNGVDASALLVQRVETCKAEFQPRGESRRKEDMPCGQAYAFQQMAGDKKVKVTKSTSVIVRFPLSNGSTHEVTVDESKVRARALGVGDRFPVVFDPRNPNDVRSRLTWHETTTNLAIIAVGLLALALLFFKHVVRMWTGVFGSRKRETQDEAVAASWSDQALSRATAAQEGAVGHQRSTPRAADGRPRGSVGRPEPRRQFGMRA